MKTKILLSTLGLTLVTAFALWAVSGNDTRIQQRDPTNAVNLFRDLPPPSGGANAIIGFDGSIVQPKFFLLGPKVTYDGTSLNVTNLNKSDVGLGNVDNTSDVNKPISNAVQGALNAKANTSSLSAVAISGSYNDLTNKPSLFSGAYADLTGKPTNVSFFTNDANYITAAGLTSTLSSYVTSSSLSSALSGYATTSALSTGLNAKFNTPTGLSTQYLNGLGVPTNFPSATPRSFNNAPGRTLVSVAAAANGFLIDAARDASVSYSVTITTSSTLAGGQSGYVVLEINTTNSAVAASWIEISRSGSGQTNGLVVGLTLNQVGIGSVSGYIPAGYYVRIRSVNTTGTPTYAVNSAQEVKL